MRRWNKLLEATRRDAKYSKQVAVVGTPHMLRHSYATALIQSGEKVTAEAT